MAITSAGVGSGIDIETIISSLMQLERQPLTALQRRESDVNAQVSAYGTIKSAVSSFQDTMEELSSADKFKIFTTASSDEDVLTATTDSNAAAGIYNLTVNRLAQNHKMGSDEKSDSATFGGTAGDELTLTIDSESVTIDLSTASTLSEIRDLINADTDNPGVTATILNTGSNNQRLILTSNESGHDNRVQLSYGGTIDSSTFNFATSNQVSGSTMVDLTELDSSYEVDGYTLTSSSNDVSDVIDGIDLKLKSTGDSVLSIERDTASIEESAKSFVNSYNFLVQTMNRFGQNDLSGDSTLRSISSLMRGVINTAPTGLTGSFDALSQLGIKTDAKTGDLTLDSSDFSDALDADFDAVAEIFSDDDQGFAFRLEALAETLLDTDGIIDSRTDGLGDRVSSLQDSQAEFERRLELKEKALRSQYAALDGLVASMNSTSSFLLASINNL